MKNLAIASIAAFAALVITSNMAATAANDRAARMEMAQAPAPEVWFIKGIVTISGEDRETRFFVPGDNGQPVVLSFASKDECEDASKNDPDIAGPLAMFKQTVASRGGVLVVTCERFVHPPKGEQI